MAPCSTPSSAALFSATRAHRTLSSSSSFTACPISASLPQQRHQHATGSETTFGADRPHAQFATPFAPTPQGTATYNRFMLFLSAWRPCALDQRKVLVCYFALIFACRLSLRLPCSAALHWVLVMLMEDGMSLTSFAIGLHYLNSSNGAAMSLLTKCVTRSNEAETTQLQQPVRLLNQRRHSAERANDAAVASNAAPSSSTSTAGAQRQQPIRLFYFAM